MPSVRYVDSGVTYTDVDTPLSSVTFDIFAAGGNQSLYPGCMDNGRKVVRMERTPVVSSSGIRKTIEKLE